ncbi:LCP family protein, partial [Clostridium perfringens]|uniref:LCP family protein n=1 Tax=Clostridium perfringens TaxID=1502 RepID=UPI002AC5A78A
TLVNIPEYGENKINAAFAFGSSEQDEKGNLRGAEGGAALLMETIQENFNLKLDKYIIVNFWGFESIIDEIGGIEVDIKDYEIEEVNKYIGESTGVHSPPITETGLHKVNGQQALSYARIRYVGNGNFERGERQTKVLYQIASKLKQVNPLKYVGVANTLAEQVKTNIDIP